jgi:hypothetical protein
MDFDYTVGLGQVTRDLTVSGVEFATPGSITDRAGNAANLVGAGVSFGLGVNADPNGIACLSVTDGSRTANVVLLGSYVAANFVMSNDGGGHVLITDPPLHQ